MDLQSFVEIAKEIEYLRKARDLLREVQSVLNNDKPITGDMTDKINYFFNYDKERGE